MTGGQPSPRRFVVATGFGAGIGLLPVLIMLSGGRLSLSRTAVPGGTFSNFFDQQARALMEGHFDLRRGSLAIESFVIGGRTYTYFPPFPAILRMPILLFTERYDGRLTGTSMLLATVVTAAATAALLWRIRGLLGRPPLTSRREAALAGIFVASVTGGSALVYLSALPWAYHEVYAWSIALATVAMWAIAGILTVPRPKTVIIACAAVTAENLTRSTVGWGLCIALVLCAVWSVRAHHRWQRGGPVWPWLIVAAVLPFAAGAMVTWIKFGSPMRFLPLDTQVWTMVNQQRQRALAANGGGLTNIAFIRTTVPAYVNPLNIRLRAYFPFVSLPASPPAIYGNVTFDQTYRVGGATAFMPLLFVLSATGVSTLLRRRVPGHTRRLLVGVAGTVFAFGGILAYGYMANRYVSDFMPFLITAGTIGVTQLAAWADTMSRRQAQAVVGCAVALGAWGGLANAATAITTMNLAGGEQGLNRYVSHQLRLADALPGIAAPPIRQADALPDDAEADTIQVVGRCDALFVATGETHEPWALASGRAAVATVELPDSALSKAVDTLIEFTGPIPAAVDLEADGRGSVRMRLRGPIGVTSNWMPAPPGTDLRFAVGLDSVGHWLIVGPDLSTMPISVVEYDAEWYRTYRLPVYGDGETTESSAGWRVRWDRAPADPVCEHAVASDER